MTSNPGPSAAPEPPTDVVQLPFVFAQAFNAGDVEAVDRVYEAAGVLVPAPGQPVTGPDRVSANRKFIDLGLPIDVRPRHTYVTGDIALLVVDWTIAGPGPDGAPINIQGTATDVARRGADGRWRYVIDNPFGALS